jgi:hypothetical protein
MHDGAGSAHGKQYYRDLGKRRLTNGCSRVAPVEGRDVNGDQFEIADSSRAQFPTALPVPVDTRLGHRCPEEAPDSASRAIGLFTGASISESLREAAIDPERTFQRACNPALLSRPSLALRLLIRLSRSWQRFGLWRETVLDAPRMLS